MRTRFVDAAERLRPAEGRERRPGRAAPPPARAAGPGLPRGARRRRASLLEGAGAAGGLAGGLAAVGARLVEGFEVVADEVELYDRIEGADLVITGEGFLDEQSFEGKVVGGVAELAAEAPACPSWPSPGRCSTSAGRPHRGRVARRALRRAEATPAPTRSRASRTVRRPQTLHDGALPRRSGPTGTVDTDGRSASAGRAAGLGGLRARRPLLVVLGVVAWCLPGDLAAADPRRRHRLHPQPGRHAAPGRGTSRGRRHRGHLPRRRRHSSSSSVCSIAPLAQRPGRRAGRRVARDPRRPRGRDQRPAERSEEDDWPIQIPTWDELEDQFSNGGQSADEDLDANNDGVISEQNERPIRGAPGALRRAARHRPRARSRVFHVGIIFLLGADHRLLPARRPAPPRRRVCRVPRPEQGPRRCHGRGPPAQPGHRRLLPWPARRRRSSSA